MTNFLKKSEADKGQDSPPRANSQGPSKHTHAHSNKIEETSKKDEVKATTKTMHSLVDQDVNLINTP